MKSNYFAIGHDFDDIHRMNMWLDDLATQRVWATSTSHDIKLCLNEAVTNIVSYGFESTQNPQVELFIQQGETGVLARLTDNGMAFNPLAYPVQKSIDSDDDVTIGGFGIKLMRARSTRMHYQRKDQCNQLEFFWDFTST